MVAALKSQVNIVALKAWMEARRRARTDLLYLCNEVLLFKDVKGLPHGMLIEKLQQFPEGEELWDEETGIYKGFRPACDMWDLKGFRRSLFLWPRGHLKTTILTIAHSIQWIINYPDVRILISTAVADQAETILRKIKTHFQFNIEFRELFPEFVPAPNKIADFGNQEEFTVPNRTDKTLGEPSVKVTSIGKVISSFHYDVIKHSDLVDKENVRTDGGIRQTNEHFRSTFPLLHRNKGTSGWVDVEGTRYSFSDTYGSEIIDKQEKLPADKRTWSQEVRPAHNQDYSVILWPSRWTKETLQEEQNNVGDVLYSANYLNNPISDKGGLAKPEQIVFLPRKIIGQLNLRLHATIDLHGMEDNKGNDYTVITVAGFDGDGRLYILDIRRARFTPFEVVENIFDIHKRYKLIDIKIEKDSHARVLLPFLFREEAKRGIYPVINAIKRDSRQSKKNRIMGLQPWFQSGIIRFADDLSCRLELLAEITRFPAYEHDDILDTLSDQMQNRDGGLVMDILPDRPRFSIPSEFPTDKFLGFDENGKERWLLDQAPDSSNSYWPMTGI